MADNSEVKSGVLRLCWKYMRVPAVIGIALFLSALAIVVGSCIYETPVHFDTGGKSIITYTPLRQIVPGDSLPERISLQNANNNLDVILYKERYYFAFRTAPTHFASKDTRIYVVSSSDQVSWNYETEFALGSDLREPRFLNHKGRLLLYFLQNGEAMLKFEPRQSFASEFKAPGEWTKPKPVYEPGYVMWRFKSRGELAYAGVYRGVGLYNTGEHSGEVRLLVSSDGYDWAPVSETPQTEWPGAEEPEFDFDEEGNLVALVRLEMSGGSLLCTAPREDLSRWHARYSPYKYDSSLMFRQGGSFYVIARRNIAGLYSHAAEWLGARVKRTADAVFYSLTRKRTALYRVDLRQGVLLPVLDFPSRGDTAFAGIVPLKNQENSYWLLNYSSPIQGFDWPWLFGQLQSTRIYETTLAFSKK